MKTCLFFFVLALAISEIQSQGCGIPAQECYDQFTAAELIDGPCGHLQQYFECSAQSCNEDNAVRLNLDALVQSKFQVCQPSTPTQNSGSGPIPDCDTKVQECFNAFIGSIGHGEEQCRFATEYSECSAPFCGENNALRLRLDKIVQTKTKHCQASTPTQNSGCGIPAQECFDQFTAAELIDGPCGHLQQYFECSALSCNEDNALRLSLDALVQSKFQVCQASTPTDNSGSGPIPESNPGPNVTDVQINDLRAEYLGGTNIMLSWKVAPESKPSTPFGFRVMYKPVTKRPQLLYEIFTWDSPHEVNGMYTTILDVKAKTRYSIEVRAFQGDDESQSSEQTYIYVSGIPLWIVPSMTINAAPLDTDTVLVTYVVLGDRDLSNVNLFFAATGDAKWTQVYKEMVALRGTHSAVLTGMEPGTKYYVFAKSWLEGSYQTTLTSVTTPASDDDISHCEPEGLSLTQRVSTDGINIADWAASTLQGMEGFKATLTISNNGENRTEVTYLASDVTSMLLSISEPGTVSAVKIQPFDVYGLRGGAQGGRK